MEKENRQKRIIRASVLGIIINLVIALAKISVGLAASSLAIVSEGINNAADAGSSFLTLAGTKLSAKHPDDQHPFGYGRIEYLTSLTISVIILYTGITLLLNSVKGILHPEEMSVSLLAIALVAVSAVIKFFLGMHILKEGRETQSASLAAVGREGRNDSFFSLVTITASILYLTMHISVDAWVGVLFAVIIIRSGFETLRDTISELIGRPGERELATRLYKEIRSTDGIINAADMMLHNYGPDAWSGSVNIEIDHKKNIGEIYEFLHELQLRIMHEYHVTLVFGIYAVNNDGPFEKEMRSYVGNFVRDTEHVLSFHALYKSQQSGRIYVDLIVDYELADWDALEDRFAAYMKEKYPENEIELTIETQFV